MDADPTPLSRIAAQAILDTLDEEWYCLNCGRPRPVWAWGSTCVCGGNEEEPCPETSRS